MDDAKALFDTDGAVFVDTRSADAWNNSAITIPGAIRVPPDAADRYLSEIPRDRPIVTFCT